MTTERARRVYQRRCEELRVAIIHRVCRRIESGLTLTEACRDPTTAASPSTVRAWMARYPELGALVAAAEAQADQRFPRRREYHRYDEAVAAEFLARIEDGLGLREVCAERDMPVHATILRWARDRPDFDKAYRQAREAQADRLFDLAWRIACEATEETVRADRLRIDTLRHRIGRLAPRKYGPWKAQAPESLVVEAADEDGRVRRFYFRHFARTPENKVVETTEAVCGLQPDEIRALNDGLRSGRISLEALEEMKRRTAADLGEESWSATG